MRHKVIKSMFWIALSCSIILNVWFKYRLNQVYRQSIDIRHMIIVVHKRPSSEFEKELGDMKESTSLSIIDDVRQNCITVSWREKDIQWEAIADNGTFIKSGSFGRGGSVGAPRK